MCGISVRQLELLKAVRDSGRLPPTHRDLMERLGLRSTNAVHECVMRCVSKGLLETLDGKARAIFLTEAGEEALREAGGS